MPPPKLSILIPVYNESSTVLLILQKILNVSLINNIEKEIIIINDGSSDNSREILEQFIIEKNSNYITLINHTQNQGKGAALHKAINLATGEYLIIQDADLEYNPEDYNILLKQLLETSSDVVYGSRFMQKPTKILFFNLIGNKVLTFLSNLMSDIKLTDLNTCYKLFKTDIIKHIKLQEKRFGFDPEITAKVSRVPKIKITEVSIFYRGRDYHEGKKIRWSDGIRSIFCILKYNI